jgi:hypothetical protein
MSTHTVPASTHATCRYWVLVDNGHVHQLTWADGEKLLALACEVQAGTHEPQAFTFRPRGQDAASPGVEVTVIAEQPLNLLTAYDCSPDVAPSHWFG